MISVEVKREAFQEFDVNGEDSLGLDIETSIDILLQYTMNRMMKCIKAEEL